MDAPARLAVWLDDGQEPLARAIVAAAGVEIAAAGSPAGPDVAARLGAPQPLPDLRSTLADAGAGLDVQGVLVLSPQSIGVGELGALAAATSRRVLVASLEPVPSRLDDLTSASWLGKVQTQRPIDACRPLARFRRSPAMRNALDMLEAFGPIRAAWLRCEGTPAHGSLGARLIDGLDLLHDLLGPAETVHAAATAIDPDRPADDLAAITGEIVATLTHAGATRQQGVVACVQATSRASGWRREAVLLGEAGVVRLNEGSFVWTDPAGKVRDEWRATGRGTPNAAIVPNAPGESESPRAKHARGESSLFEAADPASNDAAPSPRAAPPDATDAIAESLRRLLDPHAAAEPPSNAEHVLAAAHAAILSARTRNTESPATIRRLFARD
ncbi:MAG: hypothetical protein KDA05_12570 [Phycisphaerales bacterium]|nr:hypothetical protein [Phycisphaerales bacterium]MCB9841027.1 hypothetical protein [Phycisphaeraceae bacterium]